ncbi:MAG: hypothetical protein R3Y54_07745 [Eubacteriales bacterium]
MNQEELFAKNLQTLMIQAKQQGNMITKEQIDEQFGYMEFTKEQLGFLYEYLLTNKIGVGQEVELDQYLSEDEKNYLAMYLEDIQSYEKVSEQERVEIIQKSLAQVEGAKEQLIQIYLQRVVEIAKLYTGQGFLLEDLIGEGNIGLTLASEMLVCCEEVEEVDGMVGKMIMDAMEEYIAQDLSAQEADKIVLVRVNELAEKVTELAKLLERQVTIEELSAECGYSSEDIREWIRISGNQIELLESEG